MRKGAKAYLAANLVSQAFALVRFALLARLLGAEQLGLAAMLILTSQFFQSVSDTGSERFLVQDKDGDTPQVQGVIHFVLAVRGILVAIALVVSSGLVARLFHAPALQASLIGLALTPLIGGFAHLDYRRVQRQSDFRPESIGMLVSETLGLVATVAAAFITRDATAVVYGLAVRAAALVVVSHLTAKRPYRWAFAREEGLRFSKFAAPLFLNGLLLFFGSQGDRVVVGNGLGAEALGHYSAVLLLIFYPTTMMIRLIVGFFLPQLARARDVPERYAAERERLGGRVTLAAIAILVGFTVLGPIATPILYGSDFVEPLRLFGLIAALQTARFIRVWPTTVANSIGRSTIILANNIARLVGIALAVGANALFPSLEAVTAAFFVGEIAALLTALALLSSAGAVVLRRESLRIALLLLWSAAAIGWTWGLQGGQVGLMLVSGVVTLAGMALLVTERTTISESIRMVGNRLRRRRA